jgi:hypothetical protein
LSVAVWPAAGFVVAVFAEASFRSTGCEGAVVTGWSSSARRAVQPVSGDRKATAANTIKMTAHKNGALPLP